MKTLLLTTLALSICLISACGGAGSSPESLRDAYVQALKDKDMDKALSLSSKKFNDRMAKAKENDPERMQKNFGRMCTYYLENLEEAEVSAPAIDGDKAEISYKKGYVTFTFKMVKEDGAWKMDKGSLKDETPLDQQGQ